MASKRKTLARIVWLANLSQPTDGLEFTAKNDAYLPGDLSPWTARIFLRQMWHGGEEADRITTLILSGQITLASTVNQMAEAIANKAETPVSADAVSSYCQARADWKREELTYLWQNEFQKDVYALLLRSHLARVCAFPDCKEPYFIAKRSNQKYCSAECIAAMQAGWRRDWWNTHGNAWRKNRKRGKANG